mmetsp:Transcript_7264/g.11053  ORF Transcript_7264/g.11053 Transcript_7264/m.11053 type:complete len:142 (+) Transcript_7264:36-461(+)
MSIFLRDNLILVLMSAMREQSFLWKHKTEAECSSVAARQLLFDSFCRTYSLRSSLGQSQKSVNDRKEKPVEEKANLDDLFDVDNVQEENLASSLDIDSKYSSSVGASQPSDDVKMEDVVVEEPEPQPRPKKKRRKKRKKFV